MIPRRIVGILIFLLASLVVASCVVFGAAALFQAMADEMAAAVLRWIGLAGLLLLAVNLVLLVGALAINSLHD